MTPEIRGRFQLIALIKVNPNHTNRVSQWNSVEVGEIGLKIKSVENINKPKWKKQVKDKTRKSIEERTKQEIIIKTRARTIVEDIWEKKKYSHRNVIVIQ